MPHNTWPCRSWLLALATMIVSASDGRCQAANGNAELAWKDLLDCELVVVGRYKSHEGSALSLEVIEVLRGKACKPGDVLPVKMSQAFTIKTSPRFDKREKASSRVSTIYLVQEQGPNVQETTVVSIAEKAHVYFFPQEKQLTFDRPSQVHSDRRVGWKQALAGKPIELSFRLLHDIHSDMSKEAIVELYKTRDRKAIADVVDALIVMPRLAPPDYVRALQVQAFVERILITLGDKDGDVYEPVFKAMSGGPGGQYDNAFRLSRILARSDAKRALADYKKLLGQPRPPVSVSGVIWGMHCLETEEGLDYLLELLVAGAPQSLDSLRSLMHNDQPIAVPMVKRARVQDLAVPKLEKILKANALSKEQQSFAMFREYFRSLVHPVPENELHQYGPQFFRGQNHPPRKAFPDWDRLVYEASGDPEPLLKADLVEGRKLIAALMKNADPTWKVDAATLAHFAHYYGDPEMARAHPKPADPLVRYRDTNTANKHRTTLSEFKKLFKETPKSGDAYWAQIIGIFPDFPEEYFQEIEILLKSENEWQRELAIKHQLESHFFWNFDFDAKDFPPVRERKFEAMKPLFAKMRKGDLLHMRGALLQHFGVKLEGPPSKKWLPVIHAAALAWNPTIKLNALHVLGMLEEDSEVTRFANYPVLQRKKAIDEHLQRNRDRLKEAGKLADARIEQLWKDLGGERGPAYAAMKEMADHPQSVVPWLHKNLKEPGQEKAPDVKRCSQLIADLASPAFKVRLQAMEELKKLGEGTVPHLRQAVAKAPDLETRRRIEELLSFHGHENARYHRLVRAIQVLEYSPGPDARAFLQELASGNVNLSMTHEARLALERLQRYWRW